MDKLTELSIKQTRPRKKQYKIFDGGGMFLLIHPNGSKYWRMNYNFGGKNKLASFGVWPQISLKEARSRRYEAKKKIKAQPEVLFQIDGMKIYNFLDISYWVN